MHLNFIITLSVISLIWKLVQNGVADAIHVGRNSPSYSIVNQWLTFASRDFSTDSPHSLVTFASRDFWTLWLRPPLLTLAISSLLAPSASSVSKLLRLLSFSSPFPSLRHHPLWLFDEIRRFLRRVCFPFFPRLRACGRSAFCRFGDLFLASTVTIHSVFPLRAPMASPSTMLDSFFPNFFTTSSPPFRLRPTSSTLEFVASAISSLSGSATVFGVVPLKFCFVSFFSFCLVGFVILLSIFSVAQIHSLPLSVRSLFLLPPLILPVH